MACAKHLRFPLCVVDPGRSLREDVKSITNQAPEGLAQAEVLDEAKLGAGGQVDGFGKECEGTVECDAAKSPRVVASLNESRP